MKQNKITEKRVELIADEGKVLTDGKNWGKKLCVHVDLLGTWKEVDASLEPQEVENPINYEEEVNNKIREKYSLSQELAILRQRDTKPLEFQAYNDYAEQCKSDVKKLM